MSKNSSSDGFVGGHGAEGKGRRKGGGPVTFVLRWYCRMFVRSCLAVAVGSSFGLHICSRLRWCARVVEQFERSNRLLGDHWDLESWLVVGDGREMIII